MVTQNFSPLPRTVTVTHVETTLAAKGRRGQRRSDAEGAGDESLLGLGKGRQRQRSGLRKVFQSRRTEFPTTAFGAGGQVVLPFESEQ